MKSFWQRFTKSKPVSNDDAPVEQGVQQYVQQDIQQDVQHNVQRDVQQDVQQEFVNEYITQPEDLDSRSMFVDETSLDFIYWNSYVPII